LNGTKKNTLSIFASIFGKFEEATEIFFNPENQFINASVNVDLAA
jgi:hypothetical protein